jgi:uncharacterized protein with HEPN domain
MENYPHIPWKITHIFHRKLPTYAMEIYPHIPWNITHIFHGKIPTYSMENYPHIPWKMVADALGSAKHTLGNTCLRHLIHGTIFVKNIY